MINNPLQGRWHAVLALAVVAACGAGGCDAAHADSARDVYQGVAELDERRLAFEVAGRLTQVLVEEGDRVSRGALLATLDGALDEQARAARELEARAAQAQSRLVDKGVRPEEIAATRARLRAAKSSEELLKRKVERERDLYARGVTPAAALDELEGQLSRAVAEREALESVLSEQVRGARPEEREMAKARAEAAQAGVALDELRIERRELRAPADGVVLDVHADPGEIVGAGAPVFTLAEPGRIHAEVFVPHAELSGIDVGDRAAVRADGVPSSLAARVEHIARRTEFTPRYLFSERERANLVVRVRVRIEDPRSALHAGLPVFVHIERGAAAPASSR